MFRLARTPGSDPHTAHSHRRKYIWISVATVVLLCAVLLVRKYVQLNRDVPTIVYGNFNTAQVTEWYDKWVAHDPIANRIVAVHAESALEAQQPAILDDLDGRRYKYFRQIAFYARCGGALQKMVSRHVADTVDELYARSNPATGEYHEDGFILLKQFQKYPLTPDAQRKVASALEEFSLDSTYDRSVLFYESSKLDSALDELRPLLEKVPDYRDASELFPKWQAEYLEQVRADITDALSQQKYNYATSALYFAKDRLHDTPGFPEFAQQVLAEYRAYVEPLLEPLLRQSLAHEGYRGSITLSTSISYAALIAPEDAFFAKWNQLIRKNRYAVPRLVVTRSPEILAMHTTPGTFRDNCGNTYDTLNLYRTSGSGQLYTKVDFNTDRLHGTIAVAEGSGNGTALVEVLRNREVLYSQTLHASSPPSPLDVEVYLQTNGSFNVTIRITQTGNEPLSLLLHDMYFTETDRNSCIIQ